MLGGRPSATSGAADKAALTEDDLQVIESFDDDAGMGMGSPNPVGSDVGDDTYPPSPYVSDEDPIKETP